MAIYVRDPADHDPQWKGRKKKALPPDVLKVSEVLHFKLRHYLKEAPSLVILEAAIAVVRALQVIASDKGKQDVMKRHASPGGSHDMAAEMRKVWASGKYGSRDKCAEGEHARLGISFNQARNALINAPAPHIPSRG